MAKPLKYIHVIIIKEARLAITNSRTVLILIRKNNQLAGNQI
jgi:hypothetical protein